MEGETSNDLSEIWKEHKHNYSWTRLQRNEMRYPYHSVSDSVSIEILGSRLLSHIKQSRSLSHNSINIRKHAIRTLQNTKNQENRSNSNRERSKWKIVTFWQKWEMICFPWFSWYYYLSTRVRKSPAISDRRSLSHNGWPLSQKNITIRKYTIRAVQNTQKLENLPNSDEER